MRLWAAFLLAMIGVSGAAFAQTPETCPTPPDLLTADYGLPKVQTSAKTGKIKIAVVGSGSSALSGPDGADAAYPARLNAALSRRIPSLSVQMSVNSKGRETAVAMAEILPKILVQTMPDLVIWQTGTVEAIRGSDPDVFLAALEGGITTLQAGGANVILMNMQYSPRTEFVVAVGPYMDDMQAVAQKHGVLLFNQLAIMRHWNDSGYFDLFKAAGDNVLAKAVHDCIGRGLATMIMNGAQLKPAARNIQ